MNNSIKGLLLVGGKSTRMGSDKSELTFHDGKTQTERGLELLASVCDETFLSVREDQGTDGNSIIDAFGEIGPLGAIASAQQAHPDATWLVLACDLPLLEKEHLQALVDGRDTSHDATYFTSATDGNVADQRWRRLRDARHGDSGQHRRRTRTEEVPG